MTNNHSTRNSNEGRPIASMALRTKRQFLFERLDHTGVNQRSTAHDSDLPGASVAAYGE